VAVTHCLGRLGRLDDAIQLRAPPSASAALPATDAPWEEWSFFVARVGPLTYAGRLAEAEELVSLAYGRITDTPWAEAKAYVAAWFAVVRLEQGRPMSAFRLASEAYTLFKRLGRPYRTRWPTFTGAHSLAIAGQGGRAGEMLDALDALAFHTSLINETDLIQARAWTAAAGGDLPSARELLGRAADLGEEIGDLIGAAAALHGLARLGRACQVATRLSTVATHIEGELVAARATYASALANRDHDALVEVSRDFERLGTLLYAAEARAEVAVILRRAGDARKATAAEHESARLLAHCEGAATPPVRLITAHVRLTPGELDVALKASAGQANKQIAADLHLSVRTVENRLQRVYEKLGAAGRHHLGDALRDLSIP
jgi:DNA-binding CsgD family transcriptional regulator